MSSIPQNVSESVRRLNPHLFGPGVRAVQTDVTKPARPLDDARPKLQSRAKSVPACCRVSLIATFRRELDSDNLQGAMKPLRDAVAQWLGVDDRDSRVKWEYGQSPTQGKEGVIIKIETL